MDPKTAFANLQNITQNLPLTRDGQQVTLNFNSFTDSFMRAFEHTPPLLVAQVMIHMLEMPVFDPDHNKLEDIVEAKAELKVRSIRHTISDDLKRRMMASLQKKSPTDQLLELGRIYQDALQQRVCMLCPPLPDIKAKLAGKQAVFDGPPPTLVMSPPDSWENDIPPYSRFYFLAMNLHQRASWEAAKDVLEGLGAKVELIGSRESDSTRHCFTRDAVVMLGAKILQPMRTDPEMLLEQPPMKKRLQAMGLKNWVQAPDSELHGGNIIEYPGTNIVFVGATHPQHLIREMPALHRAFPDRQFVPLLLNSKHSQQFFHLDLAMMPLQDGHLMTCMEALGERSRQDLLKHVPANKLIQVPLEDGRNMACNGVMLGDTVVCPYLSADVKADLHRHGLKTIDPTDVGLPPKAFNLPRGSLHCMTLDVPGNIAR